MFWLVYLVFCLTYLVFWLAYLVFLMVYLVHQLCNLNQKSMTKTSIDLRCFVARQFLLQIYALFWRTFYRPKKYGGVLKMTIIRYEITSEQMLFQLKFLCFHNEKFTPIGYLSLLDTPRSKLPLKLLVFPSRTCCPLLPPPHDLWPPWLQRLFRVSEWESDPLSQLRWKYI